MSPLDKMKVASINFTKTDFLIYDYIVGNPSDVVHSNILEIAQAAGVSKSALLRFTQKVGYSGFSEFKYDFSRYVHSGASHNIQEKASSCFEEIIDIYQQTINLMKETTAEIEIQALVDAMLQADRIKIFGVNRTGFSAQQLRHRFHKIDFDGEAVTDQILLPEIAYQGRKHDLHIYFSTLANTPVMIESIKNSHDRGIKSALITMNDKGKMNEYASMKILLPTTKIFMSDYFLDLQAINFIFIEILIAYLGEKLNESLPE